MEKRPQGINATQGNQFVEFTKEGVLGRIGEHAPENAKEAKPAIHTSSIDS